MAMKTRSPWWLSAFFAVGLVALFTGERAFSHLESLRMVLSGLGALILLSTTAVRGWLWLQSEGRQRRVELISLLCQVGALLGLAGYGLTTDTGVGMLGIEEDDAIARFRTAASVVWSLVLLVSLVPLLMIEISQGVANRSRLALEEGEAVDASVDLHRVREMVGSGLTIALAAGFLMVTCNIAEQRNIRKDVSYFKTSSPGDATVAMVESLSEPLTVLLFFPEVNEVATEVEGYFNALAQKTGNLHVERRDRLIDSGLAKEHKVNRDGTIVLVRGNPPAEGEEPDPGYKSESFVVDTDIEKARRTKLREFDEAVQKPLMKVLRDKKTAYFTVGHGELNDPKSVGPLEMVNPLAKSTMLKQGLRQLNYVVKDWDGFGKPVPDDASVLLVLAPRKPLLPEEIQAIDDYLARGGSVLFALDPDSEATLGELEGRLGVKYDPTPLADDKEFMVRTRTVSDHYLVLTNQFSSHAAITTLSRGAARAGILLIKPGSFEEVPFTEKAGASDPKRTFIIRSMASTFRDVPGDEGRGNFKYDKDTESRKRYNVAAVIEDPAAVPENLEEGETHDGMRAMLIADGEVFSDAMLSQVPMVQALVVDGVKWLGGEEEFAGATESEKDVRIEHTKSQDAVWFYSTVVGMPLLILGLGLAIIYLRRRSANRRTS